MESVLLAVRDGNTAPADHPRDEAPAAVPEGDHGGEGLA